MGETKEEKERRKRKEINSDILQRLKNNELLQDSAAKTWFPPRPIIAKDPNLVKKIYGEDVKVMNTKPTIGLVKGGDDGEGKGEREREENTERKRDEIREDQTD